MRPFIRGAMPESAKDSGYLVENLLSKNILLV